MVKYRKFKQSDIIPACKLITATYKKYNRREGSKAAINKYLNQFDPKIISQEKLEERFARATIAYVATDNKKIIGLIRGRKDRLVTLFVDGSYHKKRIGKKLAKLFEIEAKKIRGKIIKVRASIYAVPFYQKIGYKKTTGPRSFHGLKIQPMKKNLIK